MTPLEEYHPKKKTILIFGISSFVGSNLGEFFKDDYRVVGTYYKSPVRIPGILTLKCDVLDKDEVQLVLFATRPDIAIYCIGISSVYECSKKEEVADALNASGLFNVTESCSRYKSQVVYLSSNFVFSGEDKGYMEIDIPDPNTVLGKTQASSEFYIQKTSLNYIVFRCCRLYGRGVDPVRWSWFENMQRCFFERKQVPVDNTLKMGFLDIFYLAMVMRIAFEKGVMNRLFQVSSTDQVTFYEFSKSYSKAFKDSSDILAKAKWPFPTLPNSDYVEKPQYTLDISNIEGFLNIKLPTVEESLEFTFNRLHGDTSGSKKSSGEGVTFI